MVDCMCVWLYSTLGYEQLNKASVLLGCTSTLHMYIYYEDLNLTSVCPLHNNLCVYDHGSSPLVTQFQKRPVDPRLSSVCPCSGGTGVLMIWP